ncbi:cyclin-K-like [Antechinus flavipes]|uniref:cyclin-K-like n=1 Tax=Antechinus flavipes TaxID=38775 RepID=UPI0022358DE6|nr:cyclin-K-like [Antechinus flavipes]
MMGNEETSSSSETLANQTLDYRKPCWYWDKKNLSKTPSLLEGLDPAIEAQYRREGARFIFDVGISLRLPYFTVATGVMFFQRFYMFRSFKKFPRYVTGACALFLAGKVEETPKRCIDILKTARSLLNDSQFMQFGSDPKEEIFTLELELLESIKFDFQVEHPYKFLVKYTTQLKGDKNQIQKLVQMAWTFVNDSLCTTLSLQWKPDIIAVSVMYLAGHLCKFKIQEWTSNPLYKRWWEQFVPDVSDEVLEDICLQILDLYSQEHQQRALHIPHQLQQPESLQSRPQVPSLQCCDNSSSILKILNGGSPKRKRLSSEQQQAQQSKKPSLQPNSPRKVKQSLAVSSREDNKAAESSPSKISQIQTIHPSRLPGHRPPQCQPVLTDAVSIGERKQTSTMEIGELPNVQIAPQSYSAPVYQPPPLPHHPSLPPFSHFTTMSNTNSYISEGYENMQFMRNTDRPFHGVLPPEYGQATHLPYPPHIHPLNPPSLVPPALASSFPPPIIPTPTSANVPPPAYNFNFHPPQLPPAHADPSYSYPGLSMPPPSYPLPFVPQDGQPPVPHPIFSPGMSISQGLNHSTWMK